MSRSLVLVLVFVFLIAPGITIIQPVKAQVENVATSAIIQFQQEDDSFGHYYIHVLVQIYPPPPLPSDVFQKLTVILISPMQGISGHGPYQQGPTSTDTNGSASFPFILTDSGTYGVYLLLSGQFFTNKTIYYQPGNWETKVTVHPSPTPTPTSSPSPSPTPTSSISPSPTAFPSPSPSSLFNQEPFPTVPVAAVSATVAVVIAVGLLVYSQKHRRAIKAQR
jgi:hypothetical protein